MDPTTTRRALLRHGFTLFLLAMLFVLAPDLYTNPRMAIAAHVAGLISGLFLIALGLVWNELELTPGQARWTFRTALSMYLGWAAIVLAAVWGTSGATPIAGAGHAGAPWQESLLWLLFGVFAVAIVVCCVLVLLGLRGRSPSA